MLTHTHAHILNTFILFGIQQSILRGGVVGVMFVGEYVLVSLCVCCCFFFVFCLIFNQHLHVGPIHTWGWMEVSQRRAHSQLEKRKFQNKTKIKYRKYFCILSLFASAVRLWVWVWVCGSSSGWRRWRFRHNYHKSKIVNRSRVALVDLKKQH